MILASESPRRAELLRQLGLEFKAVPSSATEILHEQLTAHEVAQINAYRKARSVAKKFPDALVLGADTLVHLEARMFGKPASLDVHVYDFKRPERPPDNWSMVVICLAR